VRHVVGAAFGSQVQVDLVDRIRASPWHQPDLALVAEVDGAVVGHVVVSHARLRHAGGERRIGVLSPLAVAPAHQGAGIGGALVREVVAAADRTGLPLVVLEGSPGYYRRFGFRSCASLGIELDLPAWAPPEAAQVFALSSYDGQDPTLRGRVVYPPAFDGLP
jgi:putative acetyltransferase